MVVFLQKNTSIVEEIYFNQIVGIVTEKQVIVGVGTSRCMVNYGCDSEGKLRVGFNTITNENIYDENSPCYVFHENIGSNNEKLIKLNKEKFNVLEINSENYPQNNPIIGWSYDSNQNKFFDPNPPVEGYILNEITLEWEPDPEKTYDLHGDGNHYRYDAENKSWIPTW
jgi:hypothetical protein